MNQHDLKRQGKPVWPTAQSRAVWLVAAAMSLAVVFSSCSHKPMYPEIGSALITSNPAGAEIIIDGQSTSRSTPCKIDGLAVGAHALTLRKQWFRILRQSITIKPGETRRQNFMLQPVRHTIFNSSFGSSNNERDMAYDPVHRRIYVTSSSDLSCRAYAIRDTVAVQLYTIALGTGQRLAAVSTAANRLFCLLTDNSMALVDLNSPTVIRRLTLPGMAGYTALRTSPDGNVVMAADSIYKRLVLLDARLGSVIKFVSLPDGPSDALFGPDGNEAYVTMPQTRTLARVDLVNSTIIATMATGNRPDDLFWDPTCQHIGFCNRIDLSVTTVDVGRWNAATGSFQVGGGIIYGLCSTSEPEYNLVIVSGISLNLYYQPTWGIGQIASSRILTGQVLKIHLSGDRRDHYVLCSGGLSIIRSEY